MKNDLIVKKGIPGNNFIYYVTSGEVRERLDELNTKDVYEG